MREKLEIAPWGPTRLEVYVACVALRQAVPRHEVKRLKRERLINGVGELTPEGNAQIGRLRHLRKEGKVEAKPEAPAVQAQQNAVKRNYPGLGTRRERRYNKKAERINRKRSQAFLDMLEAAKPEPLPGKPVLFGSAYK